MTPSPPEIWNPLISRILTRRIVTEILLKPRLKTAPNYGKLPDQEKKTWAAGPSAVIIVTSCDIIEIIQGALCGSED